MWGEPEAAEAAVTLQQPEAHRMFSQGSYPWITGLWQWRAAQAPGRGGVDSDLCLHTGFLVVAAAALACHAGSGVCTDSRGSHHLWSPFRQCSESPLLLHPETMVSCLLARFRLFPRLPPG